MASSLATASRLESIVGDEASQAAAALRAAADAVEKMINRRPGSPPSCSCGFAPDFKAELRERLDRIERLLTALVNQGRVQEWYTTEEFAAAIGKAEFTVREWCRRGRNAARKQGVARRGGRHTSWAISHAELLRYQRDGLLPDAAIETARSRTRNGSTEDR